MPLASSPISSAIGSINALVAIERVIEPVLDRIDAACQFADLARQIGIAARQIGELMGDGRPNAGPGAEVVVDAEQRQGREAEDRRLRRREAEGEVGQRARRKRRSRPCK